MAELATQPIPVKGSIGFAIFLRDISEQKQYEEALRTAKEAAEAASSAKSRFVANMSHEIRTPMNAIVGITELLRDTNVSRSQKDYLTMIQQSADALLCVISDILDFSKIEADKLELVEGDFELRESVGDMIKTVALRAHDKGLELALDVATTAPVWLRGDQHRVRQVIVNLVGNAIKFTSQGEVVLKVAPEEADGDQVLLRFSVRDTGIGIAPKRRAAVFAAFEQADNSTTRKYGGTGLGLAIASRLVHLMGGRIWLESEEGKGTTFFFTAKFRVAKGPEPGPESDPPRKVVGLRVLIVDDNDTNRVILAETLTSLGMIPMSADSAEAGLSALQDAQQSDSAFDLVVLDAHMPEVDGFELAAQIVAHPEINPRVIMLLSSGDHDRSVTRCEELSVDAYLMKPVKQSELCEAIALAINDLGHHAANTGTESVPSVHPPLDILLTDDSLVNQKVAIGLLSRQGHRVRVANNGREAVQAAKDERFDVILMDIQMPEMDGLEATAMIRARERSNRVHTPIIAMTAHAMESDREACLEAGMDGYVVKPIRASELFQTIIDVIQSKKSEKSHDGASIRDEIDNPVVDWAKALDVVQGDRELLSDITQAFLDECPKMAAQLHTALAEADGTTFQRAAHTLKGSLRYFGATKAFDIAHELECVGRDERFSEANELLVDVEAELDQIKPELLRYLETGEMGTSDSTAEA